MKNLRMCNYLKRMVGAGVVLCFLNQCGKLSSPPVAMPPLKAASFNHLWVATTDFQSGVLVDVPLLQDEKNSSTLPIHSDAVVRVPEGSSFFYVVNRLGADNIQWGVRGTKKILGQFTVGRGTNPQDIAVISSTEAYVTRFESKKLLKVNPSNGKPLKEIDLFENADVKDISSTDPDGKPEMTWMFLKGSKLFILLQRLNSENGFEPSNKSQIAVLNTKTDRVEEIITLKSTNPIAELKPFLNGFIVAEAGRMGVLDGGVEVFDGNFKSLGWLTQESKLGGDLVDCALLDSERGIAIVAKDTFGERPTTQLVLFRVSDGQMISVLRDPGLYSYQQLIVDDERKVFFLSDRNPKKPGVWVFDNQTLRPIFTGFYSTGLPPYHMALAE